MHQVTCILLTILLTFSAKADDATLKYLKNHLAALTQQAMLQQFFTEQQVRSEGQSGLKLIRQRTSGSKNYHVQTHSGSSAAAIHDHSNYDRTIGMGEFSAVMNGYEFRTRHNDYKLLMPHTKNQNMHNVEAVPFPDVPPEVTRKATVQEQVEEMREWFRAWSKQDYSKRDYRKYFRPVLCYLEGAWTTSGKDIDEPFTSDRHFIDAKTWMELHTKAQFEAYSGSKSLLENLAFLPTKIMELKNGTIPVFAQWNYRILCHPVKRDIPLDRLQIVDDLSSRMMTRRDIFRYRHSRAARFHLNFAENKRLKDRATTNRVLLDEIMEEIPGKNNYPGHLTDEGIDTATLNDDMTVKDVSRYHRWYRVRGKDAMGTSRVHRGYSDDYLFAARTTSPFVAGQTMRKKKRIRVGKRWVNSYSDLEQKWSYAIPLELIYLSPLSQWNPYNLTNFGDHRRNKLKAQKDGRNGDCSANKELLGITSALYYMTPSEFYSGGHVGKANGDTTRGATCVLDNQNKSRMVRAAGVYSFFPYIKDIGILRQRYPIFPVYGEGSSVWKELNALKEIVMNDRKDMMWKEGDIEKETYSNDTELQMGTSRSTKTSKHTHEVTLSPAEVLQCKGGHPVYKETSLANGHQHKVRIQWSTKDKLFYWNRCDDKSTCWDGHYRRFKERTG